MTNSGPSIPPSSQRDLGDELYRRALGWPTSPEPRSTPEILRDLRALVAERARRRQERRERLRP